MTGAGPDDVRQVAWDALADASLAFYAAGPTARPARGDRWFVAASGVDHGELNVAGLAPGADAADAVAVTEVLGPDLPAIVFVAAGADAATDVLRGAGFDVAPVPEPVMVCRSPPSPSGDFTCRRADTPQEHETALVVTSQGHGVPAHLLAEAVRPALRDPAVRPWVAFDGDEPVSVVWVVRTGRRLVVKEMMTPPRHQRRGAGRAVLTAALAGSWDDDVDLAVLLSTVAGQRLYASVGFDVVDPQVTAFRGIEDDVLAAIGLAPG